MTQPSSQGPCICPENAWRNDCPRHEHMQDTMRGELHHTMRRDHLAPRYNNDLHNLLFRLAQNYQARSGMNTSNCFDILIHPHAMRRLQQDPKLFGAIVHWDANAGWRFMGLRVLESHDVDEHDVRLVIKSDHPWLADLP